jgi:hypothetical protein
MFPDYTTARAFQQERYLSKAGVERRVPLDGDLVTARSSPNRSRLSRVAHVLAAVVGIVGGSTQARHPTSGRVGGPT